MTTVISKPMKWIHEKRKIPIRFFVLVIPLLLLNSCGKKEDITLAIPTSQTDEVQVVDASTLKGVNVSGTVSFAGTLPESTKIKMGGNPECAVHAKGLTDAKDVLIINGLVQNAFVYIKEGLESVSFPIPNEPVVIDQRQCMYEPRVVGVQAGQPIQLLNSDPTLHNIHSFTQVNKAFNVGLPTIGSKVNKKFDQEEVMVSLKCDLHSWMQGWIGVVSHPFFAVTNAEGRFSLLNVPPGSYTIEVWHERLGTFTQTLEVNDVPAEIRLDFPTQQM